MNSDTGQMTKSEYGLFIDKFPEHITPAHELKQKQLVQNWFH